MYIERSTKYVLNKRMIRSSFKTWAAVALATGTLYSYEKCRTYITTTILHAQNEDGGWISSFLSRKNTNDDGAISRDKINTILRKQEYTQKIDRKNFGPISWFETNHYNANNPIEDHHCECLLNLNDAYFFGIIDGHSGWHCSESLRLRLPQYISLAFLTEAQRQSFISNTFTSKEMVTYLGNPNDDCPSFSMPDSFVEKQERLKTGSKIFAEKVGDSVKSTSVSDLLKCVYLSLDADITKEAIPDGICNEPIWTGLSGAVAIGTYIKGNDLYVASTGDCRAVIGMKTSSGSWFDIPMSEDHAVENAYEVERIRKEHPNETSSVIFNGRLLGQLQPLRSFGDVVYKWTKELHREVLDKLYGRPIVAKHIYSTPPYLTAEPDVNHKKIEKDDRFMILASDGLWETVSNEVAVNIVGKYLDDLRNGIRHKENGATKLIRYALGKGDENRLSQMLELPSNVKRSYHDDITVTIVYFDADYQYLRSKL